MKRHQTAEQAVVRALEVLGDACSVRVSDYGKRVTFAAPDFRAIDAVEAQFKDVQRFDDLLMDLKSKLVQLRKSNSSR